MTALPGVGARRAPDRCEEPDVAVIERSREDPDAFAVLFDRYADDIHRYIARRLGTEAADDLMAETFVTAFQQRRRYDLSRSAARPWLYGIATNLVGRHRRAEARRLRALSRVAAEAPAERSGDAEPLADRVAARVSAEGSRAALAGALAALPARHRDVLLVIAWGDLDYAEAAQALDIPVGTVRSRLHRARKKLREALGGSDPTAPYDETDEAGPAGETEETARG
ncbi:RNA polymerase sigma factor [Streptomyces sp. SudanB52_2052]|uniref:RNA polymerase sigma factor n=1 Tax=Streptomyces sp. SudanB52_2052 TaxID=3035276 RepID=UPI000691653C